MATIFFAPKLENARNDAVGVSKALERMGFSVIPGYDLGRDAMDDTLAKFEQELATADVGLFYFAGHGLQVEGQNYLISIDAQLTQEIHLRKRTTHLNELFEMMTRRTETNILLLDACRENPFPRSPLSQPGARLILRSGLAKIHAAHGTFIAYATAPDNIAIDKVGKSNSPFTEALLEHLETPGLSIHSLMIRVTKQVYETTAKRQLPWQESCLREDFYFNPIIEEPSPPIGGTLLPPAEVVHQPVKNILPADGSDKTRARGELPLGVGTSLESKSKTIIAICAAAASGLVGLLGLLTSPAVVPWLCLLHDSQTCAAA